MHYLNLRSFVSDQLLDMAEFVGTGLPYGRLELLETELARHANDIQDDMPNSEASKLQMREQELVNMYDRCLCSWRIINGKSSESLRKRSLALRSLQSEYVAWCHEHVADLSIEKKPQSGAKINVENNEGGSDRRKQLQRIKRACSARSINGLYVLGSFDLKKTIHTQQKRACGLVNSLVEFGEIGPNIKVGIVGGGVGGVTVAVGCALQGAVVDLFEENDDLVHFQSGNTQRSLHPNIFDWPSKISKELVTNLPYLNWSSGLSSDVAAEIKSGIEEKQADIDDQSGSMKFNVGDNYRVTDIRPNDQVREGARVEIVGDDPACGGVYDVVVVAIGFGLEQRNRTAAHTPLYWENDSLDQVIGYGPENKEQILVSGTGDGALIDLIRAATKGFEQANIELSLRFLADTQLQDEVQRIEIEAENHFERTGVTTFNFYEYYSAALKNIVGLEAVCEECQKKANPSRAVTLNYRASGVFSLGSSPLNRLIVTALYDSGVIKFRRSFLKPEMISEENGTNYVLWNSQDPAQLYHRIIIRHGPDPDHFKDRFPALWDRDGVRHAYVGDLQVTTHLDDSLVFP